MIMPMTPTMAFMKPKVCSGLSLRPAVIMTVATTAPRAKPAGIRQNISQVVEGTSVATRFSDRITVRAAA